MADTFFHVAQLTEAEDIERALSAFLTDRCRGNMERLTDISGFFGMSMEAKLRYAKLAGFEDVEEDQLTRAMPLEGMPKTRRGLISSPGRRVPTSAIPATSPTA